MVYVQPIPDDQLLTFAGVPDLSLKTWVYRTRNNIDEIPHDIFGNSQTMTNGTKQILEIDKETGGFYELATGAAVYNNRWLGEIRISVNDPEDFHKIEWLRLESSGAPIAGMSGKSAWILAKLQDQVHNDNNTIVIFSGVFNNEKPWYYSDLKHHTIRLQIMSTLDYDPTVECDHWTGLVDIVGCPVDRRPIIVHQNIRQWTNQALTQTLSCVLKNPTSHLIFWLDNFVDAIHEFNLIINGNETHETFNNAYFKNNGTESQYVNADGGYVYVLKFGEDNVLGKYTPQTKTINFSRVDTVRFGLTIPLPNEFDFMTENINVLIKQGGTAWTEWYEGPLI